MRLAFLSVSAALGAASLLVERDCAIEYLGAGGQGLLADCDALCCAAKSFHSSI